MTEGRLAGRLALITGASRGIGRAVALAFAREGADLVLLARTQAGLEELDDEVRALGGRASLVPADVTDGATLDAAAAAIHQRWGRLDILVGNAGELGVLSPIGDIAPEVWERVVAVNLNANFRLLRACDPLLRAAPAGRAIFVTTTVAPGRAYWGAYAASKAALEAMVRTYAEEVANVSAVRANLLNPGRTRTRMRAAAFPLEDPATVKAADDPRLIEAFVRLATPECRETGIVVSV